MKALVLSDYMRLELLEMEDPKPGLGELLIAVRACGICGSDGEASLCPASLLEASRHIPRLLAWR